MIRLVLAAALLCASFSAHAMDPRCNGAARYQAMSDADQSGHGTGHACAPEESPNNFLAGIRRIDVVMHRVPPSPAASARQARVETCTASQYGVGDDYNGRQAADGSIFNTYASRPYTVAHVKRRLGSFVTITNLSNGKSIRAKVTDRGPFYHARCVDLGRAGAEAIGMGGTARVRVE